MSARVLHAELAAVRALVADGLAEIGDAGDAGQVWLRSAAARLTALDGVLAEAAGVLAAPVQVIIMTIMTFLVVTGSAALAGTLGLNGGGILAMSGTALLIAFAVIARAARPVHILIGHRRLARAVSPRPTAAARSWSTPPLSSPAPSPFTPSPRSPGRAALPEAGRAGVPGRDTMDDAGLAGVPDRLLRARVRLVSAALRHVGAGRWSAPQLRRAIRTDPVARRLAHADQLLCQAVDCVERHLGDLRKENL
jgi:hypothetical protein